MLICPYIADNVSKSSENKDAVSAVTVRVQDRPQLGLDPTSNLLSRCVSPGPRL